MDSIPLDFKQLIDLYLSFSSNNETDELSTVNVINSLIYGNKVLDKQSLQQISKVKTLTYDNEELRKLIISQNIKNYLIQELFKEFLKFSNKSLLQSNSSDEAIKSSEKLFEKHTEYRNKEKEFYEKVEQLISSVDELKSKYNL